MSTHYSNIKDKYAVNPNGAMMQDDEDLDRALHDFETNNKVVQFTRLLIPNESYKLSKYIVELTRKINS